MEIQEYLQDYDNNILTAKSVIDFQQAALHSNLLAKLKLVFSEVA